MASHGASVRREQLFRIKQLRDELGRFAKRVEDVPGEVLLEEAARIKEEAIMQVPVKTGTLQSSIDVSVTGSKSRKTLTATASAVSRGYDYAEIQHENLDFSHPNGGKAKYIEDPFNAGVQRIVSRLESELKL